MDMNAPLSIQSRHLEMIFSPVTGQLRDGGGLFVTEGEGKTEIQFKNIEQLQRDDNRLSFLRRGKKGGLTVQSTFSSKPTHIALELKFKNTGANPRFIQAGYSIGTAAKDCTWWDGRFHSQFGIDQILYERTQLRLPLSVIHNKDQGVAIGLDPDFLLSMFANGAERPEGRNQYLVSFNARLVLEPGQEIALPLCIFSFNPVFGYLDAVQTYYDIYPKSFSIHPEVSPKIIGSGGYLFSGEASRILQYEESRRYGMGWEWAYCPAQRPGDWYPDERYWDDKIGYSGNTDEHKNVAPGTLDDFRRDMRERFHRGRLVTASAYYLLPVAADVDYMRNYPDGIIVDEKGNEKKAAKGWIKQPFDLYYAYPWGNSYGKEMLKELKEITEDFKVHAFGFDEANRMDTQHGGRVGTEPGAAWDSGGKFSSVQVALGRLADEIHKLKADDTAVAVVMNKPWTYNTATRTDIAMHEWHAYMLEDCFLGLRLLMGHKPLSWWKENAAEYILRWQEMTPGEIRQGIAGIAAFTRLKSLRYGVFQTNLNMTGFKQYFKLAEQMAEMMKAGGWQPVPGVVSAPALWLSRYGKNLRSYIVVGNPTRREIPVVLNIHPSYFGEGNIVFTAYDGSLLKNDYKDKMAEVDLKTLPPFADRTIKAVARFSFGNMELAESSAEIKSGLARESIRLNWRFEKAGNIVGKLEIGVPDGAGDFKLLINDEEKPFTAAPGKIVCQGEIPHMGRLELSYAPEVIITGDEENILAFPFVLDRKPASTIVVPPDAEELDRQSAFRIVSFFDWYYRRQQSPVGRTLHLSRKGMREVAIPIVETLSDASGRPMVKIEQQPGKPGIILSEDGKQLTIAGATAAEREKAVLALLKLLEKRYPFYGVLPNRPIYQKAEIVGTCLE